MSYRKPIIKVPRGAVASIALAQKCGKTTVYAALNYTSDSKDAQQIRRLAISTYGGIKTYKPVND